MKYIIVPKTIEAMERFDVNQCIEGDLITIILDEKEFEAFWQCGIINAINIKLDLMIDDYEEEEVIGMKNLMQLQKIVEKFLAKYPDNTALTKLSSQVKCAIAADTGVFFYF